MELLNTTVGQIIIAIFAIINLISFFIMGHDKRKSMNSKHVRRMSEGLIFFWATMFGAIGVYLGMLMFRHKTKKWYFKIGIPILILQNIAFVYVALDLFESSI